MWVAIILIILVAAAGLGESFPERYRRTYRLIVIGLTAAFSIVNLVVQRQGEAQLQSMIERYGTTINWQASEPTLKVEGPEARKQAAYGLVLKIIPSEHERVKHLNLHLKKGYAFNEPAYLNEADARWLYWLMADQSKTIDLRNEYNSGINTYYYSGRFDLTEKLVRFRQDPTSYWPSLYPSFKDLEGKFIVAKIDAAGVDRPIFTELRVKLESASGAQSLILMLTNKTWVPGVGEVPNTLPERYVGGLFGKGRFLRAQ